MDVIRGKTTMQFGSLYALQTLRQTSERMLDTAFIGYGVQRGLYTIVGKNSSTLIRLTKLHLHDSVHNSRKNQLLSYLAWENRPSHFMYYNSYACKI